MKVALFDLDGTLVKAGGAGRKALNAAVRDLHGMDDACSEFSLAGRTDMDNFRLAFQKARGRKPDAKEAAALEQAYLQRLPGHVRRAVRLGRYALVPGVAALLRRLKRHPGVLVGLGTGNVKPGAAIKLGPSGLLHHFDFGGYGCDGYTRVTLLRAAVRRAAALAGKPISPKNVYVIGDTDKDVLAGKRAGYHTGVVTSGFGELEALRASGPEVIATDFRDPKPWLAWMGLS